MRKCREFFGWLREAPIFWPCRYCGGFDGVYGCANCWGKRPRYASRVFGSPHRHERTGFHRHQDGEEDHVHMTGLGPHTSSGRVG